MVKVNCSPNDDGLILVEVLMRDDLERTTQKGSLYLCPCEMGIQGVRKEASVGSRALVEIS